MECLSRRRTTGLRPHSTTLLGRLSNEPVHTWRKAEVTKTVMTGAQAEGTEILALIEERVFRFKTFAHSVAGFFLEHPTLNGKPPVTHSVRTRMKDAESLGQKILRKSPPADPINPANVF